MAKKLFILMGLLVMISLTACAGQATVQANSSSNSANTSGTPQPSTRNQFNTLESRLAVGTLQLEGTGLAVTPEQAKQLLPLWQKVQSLTGEGAAANATDLPAVYKQIEAVMTPDQIAQIQSMTLSQNQLTALMNKYGVQITPGAGPNGGVVATPNADQLATRSARQTQSPNSGGTGFGSGTLSPDQLDTRTARQTQNPNGGYNGGGFATLSPDQQNTRTAQETQNPGAFAGRAGFGAQVFIDPLITLLTQISGQ